MIEPSYYRRLPIECIEVTQHFDFVLGNVIKYAWRAGYKPGVNKLDDLRKMLDYAQRAVNREEKMQKGVSDGCSDVVAE